MYAGAASGVFDIRELRDLYPDFDHADTDAWFQRLLSMRGLDVSDAECR